MAEFKLDRFKYNWRGNWSAGTVYNRDDVVRVSGRSYVCLVGHTADAVFRTDLDYVLPDSDPPVPQPKWVSMTESNTFLGPWTSTTNYDLGDIVFKDGTLWVCSVNHIATSFHDDFANWTAYAEHIKFVNNWSQGQSYGPGAIVAYNGINYKCTIPHEAQSTLELDIEKWAVFHDGIQWRNNWLPTTEYRKNDLVKYGPTVFRCTETHLSGGLALDNNKFEVEFPGFSFDGEWDAGTYYQIGDSVSYGGFEYYAVANNQGVEPDDSNSWVQLTFSYNFTGPYSVDANYKPGDVTQRGGNLYVNLSEVKAGDGSSNDLLDPTVWELLKPGAKWNNVWQGTGIQYYIGDLVYFKGSAYKCVEAHLSANNNFPGDNGSGYNYWELYAEAIEQAGLQNKGDLLTYGLNRAEVGDGSTKGPTNLPIGNFEEFLSINSDQELYYRNFSFDSDVVYVALHGKDAEGYGLSTEKPFRTVQYASEYVYWNYDPLTPVKIKISTGRYDEVLPITVPAGTTVMGDELRSTTVAAAPADPAYETDWDFTLDALTRLKEILPDVCQNVIVEKTEGNNEEQIVTDNPDSGALADAGGYDVPIDDVALFVGFRVSNGDTDATISGDYLPSTDADRINARATIISNLNFLTEEMVAWRLFSDITFDRDRFRRDCKQWIRSVAEDILYTGNFRTIRSGEVYVNRVLGSQLEANMFYMRDTTTLRAMTVDGLNGRLNPPGVFELFQRPTGGAYVSLDPGAGPDDQRVWINTISPYIQGVTTLGTNAIGKKVDGALHNGGNKSMTSNDFTQVISDGIGAWILNGGRAELVSVFTYYAQIGYLAEDGGIVRATNGNNSYGRFGSVAIGIDPDETPASAEVFNRNNEAIVSAVYAGEFQDEIFAFEYAHAGEEYVGAHGESGAQAEIIGAGGGAEVTFDDTRDGGIFQSRLLNEGSGAAGGSGYVVTGNNAQAGDTTSITLATADEGTAISYTDKRILITSGDGTGQYAIISSYDPISKIATVIKESNGEAGWDHIQPGTPIQPALSNNTVYRIEPRIVVSDPGFTVEVSDLPSARNWRDLTHGQTTELFEGIVGGFGTGEVDESLDLAAATFDILRSGSEYTATIVEGGAGYAIGDQITIPGTSLGGATPANDCTIIVTANSDDSTNAVTGVTTTGTGLSGIFTAVALPNFIAYSTDGLNWTETFITQTANWSKIVNGNDKFVMISDDTDYVATSLNGIDWTIGNFPITESFTDIVFGDGKFVVIAENTNTVLISEDGENWTQQTIPDDTLGDSTASQWVKITYGAGRFVAIAGNDRGVAYSDDAETWTRVDNGLPASQAEVPWISLTYGRNTFFAVAQDGQTSYSIDRGLTWSVGNDMPKEDGSTTMVWVDVKYLNGIWWGVCNTGGQIIGADPTPPLGQTRYCATSTDAFNWTDRFFIASRNYTAIGYATINNEPAYVALGDLETINAVAVVKTGARAKFRAVVTGSQISEMKIWDPGSGYIKDGINDPELTIFDNTFVSEVLYDLRIGNGVLSQPSFINRGLGYRTSSTTVNITGVGFADIIPESNFVTLRGVSVLPGPGEQLRFATIPNLETDDETDLKIYTVSTITDLGDDGLNADTRLVRFRITPSLNIEDSLETGTSVEIRERYSQCRITGHDFLDIGTGNFEETNYPDIYASGNFFTYAPENEVFEDGGGRVFYTSTDQDGNFRAGELFSVEQATGIVTISAEFFDLDGLSELALGGVRLGGSGTVIREFSTDVTFTEDSNNVIPTQRAIITFFSNRLSQGGSEIATNNLQAGQVLIGTEENRIDVTQGELLFPKMMLFDGKDELGAPTTIQGSMLAQTYFSRSAFDDDSMQ